MGQQREQHSKCFDEYRIEGLCPEYPLLGGDERREIGENICRRRNNRGWTQEELAGRMNSDHRVISRHENGGGVDLETLIRYSIVYDCEMADLLPEKFRKREVSLIPQMMDLMRIVSTLPVEKQIKPALPKNYI